MTQNKYRFHYQEAKYGYWQILIFLGGIIGFVAVLIGWTDIILKLPWYLFVAIFILWIFALWCNYKKAEEVFSEEITFTQNGFQSHLFGTVAHKNVKSYRVSTLRAKIFRQSPAPSLHIKLQNAKKVTFDLSLGSYNKEMKIAPMRKPAETCKKFLTGQKIRKSIPNASWHGPPR